jgi:diguanylate cyclase (GGDEF)-like protein
MRQDGGNTIRSVGERPDHARGLELKVRGWIFSGGALAMVVMIASTIVVLSPLSAARTDLRRIATDGIPVQAQLVALRTRVVEWQSYLEAQLDAQVAGVPTSNSVVVEAGERLANLTSRATAMSGELRRLGFFEDARGLETDIGTFTTSISNLDPSTPGGPPDAAQSTLLVAAEREAIDTLWRTTTRIGTHLSRAITLRETEATTKHVDVSFWLFLGSAAITLLLALTMTVLLGRRAGLREREQGRLERRHAYETRVQEALEMTKSEPDVYEILAEALHESVPGLKVEMLIADSSHAHYRRAFSNGDEFEGCTVISPLDCPAASVGHPLLFPSSGALNACPYLKSRPSGACSASCSPVSIAGRTVGVTHATGADGVPPTDEQIETLNFSSRRGGERIAMIRAFATAESQAQTDPLTGLLNRRSLQNAVHQLREAGTEYALAYGDLDHFKILNDTHGHEAGDQALRLFARVLGDSLRPGDIAARYGGEEFVVVLPECATAEATGVLNRVRESLALALQAGQVPPFTVTFGVASSVYATTFDEIVAIADQALLSAKSAGRNRVTVAELVPATP